MADPVIGATVQVLLEKLLSLSIKEFRSSRDFNKDLEMLTQNVSMIQDFIHDVERPEIQKQAVERWFRRLERVAEDAEYVFDEIRYISLKAQVKQNKPMKKVSHFFSDRAFRSKMSGKINKITEELRAINQLARDLGLQSLKVPSRQILPFRETDSMVVASDVVGRDNDVAEIKRKMLNIREEDVFRTIPIVGMGGSGKTTVAKIIFNDEEIENHFDKRVWLCLPEMSETEKKLEVQNKNIIVKKLREELGGSKYLLVLDDLWQVDSTLWHEFVDTLRGINASRGNCILVTTRRKLVASTVAVAVDLHMLENLAADHCWSIFNLVLKDMPRLTEWKGVELLPTGTGSRDGLGVRTFPVLEKLIITECPLLKSTPNQFEVLRELQIEGVDSAMPLLNLCSNLTSLVKLIVKDVKELTCLPDEMLRNNFSLEHLSFSHCRQFRELPQSLYNLCSLKSLEIDRCTNFSSIPVPSGENHLTSLQRLVLYNCDGLTSLPSGMLEHCRSLESLDVCRCNNLVSFPSHFWEMPSVSYMNISKCPKLNSVPTGGLHRLIGLRELHIGPFSEMVGFETFQLIFNGIQQLSSLRTLWVFGRANLDSSLPHQLMQLSSLKDLGIFDFGIEALPHGLGNLTSLEYLELRRCKRLQHVDFLDAMPKLRHLQIYDCPLLEALSDGLVSLEQLILSNCDKLQHLPSEWPKLRELLIRGCPELEESCSNRSGPNSQWSKISHIPLIKVGWSF